MKQEKNNKKKILSNENEKVKNSKEMKNTSHKEIGGPKGKEPTRYGDWEKNGRCSDF